MTIEFTEWQKGECAVYGLSIEEHNKLLEVSGRISAAMGRSAYGDLMEVVIRSSAIPAHLFDVNELTLGGERRRR